MGFYYRAKCPYHGSGFLAQRSLLGNQLLTQTLVTDPALFFSVFKLGFLAPLPFWGVLGCLQEIHEDGHGRVGRFSFVKALAERAGRVSLGLPNHLPGCPGMFCGVVAAPSSISHDCLMPLHYNLRERALDILSAQTW